MAGVSVPSAEVLLSKRVQERAIDDEEPPHLYICRDGDEADQDVPSQLTSIPIVDFSVLSPSEPRTKQDCELQKLHSALSSWGCFQVITYSTLHQLLCVCICLICCPLIIIYDAQEDTIKRTR